MALRHPGTPLKIIATSAPSAAPAVFESRSIALASRVGRNICALSMHNDSNAPPPVPKANRVSAARVPISATANPNGAYATMLAAMSKRV